MQELWIKIVTVTAIVLTLSLLQLINRKKRNRSRQSFLPFAAFLYGMISVAVSFAFFEVRFTGVTLMAELLAQAGLGTKAAAEILAMNLMIGLLYMVIRLVLLGLTCLFFRKRMLLKKFTEIFYYYDERSEVWLLYDRWKPVKELFRWFIFGGGVLCGICLGLTLGTGEEGNAVIFPIVFQIVIVECFSFLGGYTEMEYVKKVGGEDSYYQRVNQFYKIREILEATFPHELLASYTGCDYASARSVSDLLDSLGGSRSEPERIVSDFFRGCSQEEIYDTDYIDAVIKMLKKENVLFFHPFYRDLGKYLVLPVMKTLLSDKKCLFITGRNSAREDMILWISELLDDYARVEALWRVKELDQKEPECEVGILSFSQLYDQKILDVNREFLEDVGFVFILEASRMLPTGQTGLSIFARQMSHLGEKPVYCIADRLTDGLVDTMSHLLQIQFGEVVAAPVARNIHTAMGWDADGDYLRQRLFDKQTRYLGNGIELAALAVKNQIPAVSWFGETKVPLRDIRWIAGQYYPALCRYMNLPVQQQSIYDRIRFIENIWSVPEEKEQFVIAEDEFLNLFAAMRTFLSRGKFQTFVNIFSESYLLRDYMRCNTQMFLSNPNLIPSIVPDYAKTERNVLLKLLILMSYREVRESEILRELSFLGIETDDVLHILSNLLRKYTDSDSSVFNVRTERKDMEGGELKGENIYSVVPEIFEEKFGRSLKNACYVCEEEKENRYMDARLFGHVTQTILQGQGVVYDGKYYVVRQISRNTGVILRRASGLYDGRKYYRQIRKYCLGASGASEILSVRTVMDIELTKARVDFQVMTSGYLEMNSSHDLRSARVVDLTADPHIEDCRRAYRSKTILKMRLPDTDGKMRFTICMLLSEILKSVFPDGWQYLAVTAVMPRDTGGMLNYLVYGLEGEADEECIYILEDSELDLGLLEAMEKNLFSLFEIMTDFLGWHFEKMREPAAKDPKVVTPEFPDMDGKRRRGFLNMAMRIRQLFGGKKEKEEPMELSAEEAEKKPAGKRKQRAGAGNVSWEESGNDRNESPDLIAVDGTDIFDEDSQDEDNEGFEEYFEEIGITPIEKTRYQTECFLKFGFAEIDSRIRLEDVRRYLTVRGFGQNALVKARKRDRLKASLIDSEAVNHCDFCGLPLSGVSFDKLTDGRIRCHDCSASAIHSVKEFQDLFGQCLGMTESFFSIDFKTDITVKTADARKIARGYGSVFSPSTDVAVRVVGYARREGGKFSLYVENGSPRLAAMEIMVHELTHIWQYRNWKDGEIARAYPEKYKRDIVYEGMAEWASLQYMYLIGEYSYAQKQEALLEERTDIYGIGFRMYREKYPIIRDFSLVRLTPFTQFPPL